MNNTGMRVSPDKIGRPNFAHGTLGNDMNPSVGHGMQGNVIDKYQRGDIQSFSKNAHFRMGGSGMRTILSICLLGALFYSSINKKL